MQVISQKQRVMGWQRHPGFRFCAMWRCAAGSVVPPGSRNVQNQRRSGTSQKTAIYVQNNIHGPKHIICFQWSELGFRTYNAQQQHGGAQQTRVSYSTPATSVCLTTRTRIVPEPSLSNKPSCTLVCTQLQKMDTCPQWVLSLRSNGKEFLILPT